MSSPADNISIAQSELIIAQKKIEELEEDLRQLSKRAADSDIEIAKLGLKIHKLKEKPENTPFLGLVELVKKLKQELKDTKDHIQFERDNTLHAIREVLGARSNRTEPGMSPHESALNAAKRVMEELKRHQDDLSELMALRKVATLTREIAGLVPGSSNGALIAHLKAVGGKQKFGSSQFKRKIYTLPEGHMAIKTEDFVRMLQDSEDLKVIKEKLGIDSPGA